MQLLMNFTQISISSKNFYFKNRTKMSNIGKIRKWRLTFLSSGLLTLHYFYHSSKTGLLFSLFRHQLGNFCNSSIWKVYMLLGLSLLVCA